MYKSGKTNGKADFLTQMPNLVLNDQNDEGLKYQNCTLLSPRHFEDYIANLDAISRTRTTSGM